MRAHAYASGRKFIDVSIDIVEGRLEPQRGQVAKMTTHSTTQKQEQP